ncbi:MAG: putative lipid II flippase FtsW [Verrucomicrobia bacterium A1]|nr:MAG: putative lipid II flippase FtsW [Verrucomicrobia bacterium A1]
MWKTASILVGVVCVLVTLGIVMLTSTSGIRGETQFSDAAYFLKRQVAWLVLGIIVAFAAAALDYRYWRTLALPLTLFSIALLVMVLIPGVGHTIKGSRRWLVYGQPSELAKFAAVVFLAWWMSRIQRHAAELKLGLVVPLGGLGIMLGLIFVEPDFGTTMLVGVVGFTLMFIGGTRFGYLAIAGAIGLTGFTLAVMQNAERMRRITAFLNPEKYARDEAFQLLNAIYAFVVGGPYGVGLGQSLQKHFYLPEAHTDFIFAIIGEELGLPVSIGVVLMFVGVLLCGIRISFRAPDQFGKLLGFGLTLMLTAQAVINIGVVTGSMPTKGLPLPFISFGGSSLVVSLLMIGVLVNIARQSGSDSGDGEAQFFRDAAHRL